MSQPQELIPSLERALENILEPPVNTPQSPIYTEAMRYAVLSGGKRFRARLVLACAAVCPDHPSPETVLPAAVAIELLHAYSLVHDDLPCLDNADQRRNQPSLHRRYGETLAVLVGDGLQALAFDVLSHPPQHQTAWALGILAHAAGKMVLGQALEADLITRSQSSGSSLLTISDVREVAACKTGALIEAACILGSRLGGYRPISPSIPDPFADLGQTLGFAFQLADDLADVNDPSDVVNLARILGHAAAQAELTETIKSARHQLSQLAQLSGDTSSLADLINTIT